MCAAGLKGIVWERDLFFSFNASNKLDREQGSLIYSKEYNKVFLVTCAHCIALCALTGGIAWSAYLPRISCCLPTLASLGGGVLLVAGGGDAVFVDAYNGTESQVSCYI